MIKDELYCKVKEAIDAFSQIGEVKNIKPWGNGHINDTFLLSTANKKYILQRINHSVFRQPYKMMDNIDKVTSHIIKKSTNDTERATLTVVKTNKGELLFKDSTQSYWRMYKFLEDTVSRDRVENANDFYICAKAFGHFQNCLSDFPAEELYEVIKDFHNTPKRFENFALAVEKNAVGRAALVKDEIEFVSSRREFCSILENARLNGSLPTRVTHNDTKLNNILFDANDGHAVAVIDLDTVMPGYSVNDFGDSIRFGANTAAEDETDLAKVSLDLELFTAFAKGFIEGCEGKLTDTEISLLPIGAMMMTLECGMRFLTDYLDGDVYFKIHRDGHNLDRARNQFALFADMEKKREKMDAIIRDIVAGKI
ncbi:MAG: aminoglycoside phosphotransferase family protein [Clostridia bacterium]|nr:aminoglycoside phosphotransferase family protein [Clostridia bacterium]